MPPNILNIYVRHWGDLPKKDFSRHRLSHLICFMADVPFPGKQDLRPSGQLTGYSESTYSGTDVKRINEKRGSQWLKSFLSVICSAQMGGWRCLGM